MAVAHAKYALWQLYYGNRPNSALLGAGLESIAMGHSHARQSVHFVGVFASNLCTHLAFRSDYANHVDWNGLWFVWCAFLSPSLHLSLSRSLSFSLALFPFLSLSLPFIQMSAHMCCAHAHISNTETLTNPTNWILCHRYRDKFVKCVCVCVDILSDSWWCNASWHLCLMCPNPIICADVKCPSASFTNSYGKLPFIGTFYALVFIFWFLFVLLSGSANWKVLLASA